MRSLRPLLTVRTDNRHRAGVVRGTDHGAAGLARPPRAHHHHQGGLLPHRRTPPQCAQRLTAGRGRRMRINRSCGPHPWRRWQDRGRNAGCPAPPAQVGSRTGAPTVGSGGNSNHFRVGPQSGSRGHVSSPRLVKPGVPILAPGFPVCFTSRLCGLSCRERFRSGPRPPDPVITVQSQTAHTASSYSTSSKSLAFLGAHHMPPYLLLHPVANVAKAPARMPDREVVHPPAQASRSLTVSRPASLRRCSLRSAPPRAATASPRRLRCLSSGTGVARRRHGSRNGERTSGRPWRRGRRPLESGDGHRLSYSSR